MTVLAGGTDVFPAMERGGPSLPILDITRIPKLRGIAQTETGGWRLGAATTWSDVLGAHLPAAFDGLKAAARTVGSVQIQNAGTLAGNLCNASPAADGVPPLLTLSAEVEISSSAETRTLPLSDFLTGVRKTALRPGELVTGILVPPQPEALAAGFQKLGSRRYLVISIAMVAVAAAQTAEGRIAELRIAAGACSPVARRLRRLEAALLWHRQETCRRLIAAHDFASDGIRPISDIRGTASYREDVLATLVQRALS
ncbi:MAG: FAD binding domain-containing protein, partial [Pseudomonadota bacterium]